VLAYLAAYTHRVGISNHRILSLENDHSSWQKLECGCNALGAMKYYIRKSSRGATVFPQPKRQGVIPSREDGEASPRKNDERSNAGDSSPSTRLGMTPRHAHE